MKGGCKVKIIKMLLNPAKQNILNTRNKCYQKKKIKPCRTRLIKSLTMFCCKLIQRGTKFSSKDSH